MSETLVLCGRWAVYRRLVDLLAGREGEFEGTATFEPDGRWTESGRIRFGGHEGPAGRELVIDGRSVAFPDGRPFHALDLSSGACEVEHRCGADLYRGEYRLAGNDELHVRWSVSGPRKRQEIHTTYRRVG
jgi:hypothetical protein